MQRRTLCAALLGLAAPLARAAGAAAGGGDAVTVVEIRDYKFLPGTLTVKVGTTVKWANLEKRTTHSVLFLGADGFESERLFPDESWQRRFTVAGNYPYRCGPHPEMRGRIIVE